MLNKTLIALLEAECLEKMPAKGPPPGEPNVTQAGAIELKKVIAAVSTRRQNLASAHVKLKQLALKPGMNSSAYACQLLRVKAAHQWLDFTTKRWKKMVDWAKSKGKLEGHTQKLLAYGDVQHGHALKHMEIAHTDEPHPPIADVKFDGKSELVDAHGNKFEIPDDAHATHAPKSEPKTAPVAAKPEEPKEPEPEKAPEDKQEPSEYADYSSTQQMTIKNIAADYTHDSDYLPSGEPTRDVHKAFMAALYQAGVPLTAADALNQLKRAHGGKTKKAKAEPELEKWHQATSGKQDQIMSTVISPYLASKPDKTYDAKDFDSLKQKIASDFGVELDYDQLAQLLDTAGGGPKAEPKSEPEVASSDYSSIEQAQIAALAKQHAISGSFFPGGDPAADTVAKFQTALTQVGLPLGNGAAISALQTAHQAASKTGPAAPEPPAPETHELNPSLHAEVLKTLKSGVAQGSLTADDLDTIKGVLADVGIENPSSSLLKKLSAAIAPPVKKTVTPEQKLKLAAKLTAHILANATNPSLGLAPGEVEPVLKAVGIEDPTAEDYALANQLAPIWDLTMAPTPDETAKLATKASELVAKAGAMPNATELAVNLKKVAAESIKKLLSPTTATDIINSAIENATKPKPISAYDEKQVADIFALAKQMAIQTALTGIEHYSSFKGKLAHQLTLAGTPLSDSAVGSIANEAWYENTSKMFHNLDPSKQEMLKAVAKKVVDMGGGAEEIAKAVNATQIVHLDPDDSAGMDALIKLVVAKKNPKPWSDLSDAEVEKVHAIGADIASDWTQDQKLDDDGTAYQAFKDAFWHKLDDKNIALTPESLGVVAADVWAASKAADKANETAAAAAAEKNAPPSLSELEALVISKWNEMSAAGETQINAFIYFDAAKQVVKDKIQHALVHGGHSFASLYGTAEQNWLNALWNQWIGMSKQAAYAAAAGKPVDHHPSDDIPTAKGDHPWPMKDYNPSDQAQIAGAAKSLAKVAQLAGVVAQINGTPDPATFEKILAEFKSKLADLALPLKHADAIAQLKAALGPAAPSVAPWAQHVGTYTKFKKIGKIFHLSMNQKKYLQAKFNAAVEAGTPFLPDGTVGLKKLAATAAKIHAEFKADWASSGVTQLNKDLIKDMLQKVIDEHNANSPVSLPPPPTPTPPATTPIPAGAVIPAGVSPAAMAAAGWGPATPAPAPASAAAAQPSDVMALWHAMKAAGVYMTPFEEDAIPDVYQKTIAKGKTPTYKQQLVLNKFITKAKKLLPSGPGAKPIAKAPDPKTGAEELEVAPTPPKDELSAAGISATDNPLGSSYEEIASFVKPEKPAHGPTPPPLSDAIWKDKSAFGGGGAHDKMFCATDAEHAPTTKTFKGASKATHAWMFKVDHAIPAVAYGEVAANRVQTLLGLGATENIWVQKDEHGKIGTMQHFAAQPDFRKLHGSDGDTPWLDDPKKDAIAKQLQQYEVVTWLTEERDDHPGNFVVGQDGTITGVDHGQAGKFFDSSHTLISTLAWKPPAGVFQDADKGFPKRMLKDWAAGKAVPLMPLTDTSFEKTIGSAEAIPSDLYKEMWRPYAEGLAKQGKLAGFSSVAADKTVEGFLDGMDNRRKTVRKEIASLYSHLAWTRATALKSLGDSRPISTIESEVRDQIGLDNFLNGKPAPIAKPDHAIVAKAVSDAADAAPGWDESQLPATSHVPEMELLQKHGHAGVDMMVGGKDVKDGRLQFFQLGDNAMATFMLEAGARAKLEARLPDGGGAETSGPMAPEPPEIAPFKAPPKPDFSVAVDGVTPSLHKKVLDAAGFTSDKLKPDGSKLSKIEKHIEKWKKGEASDSNKSYLTSGYKVAEEMSQSADPVEKAAGHHYLAEFAKMGEMVGGSFVAKDPATVPEAERKEVFTQQFAPSKAHVAAQKVAKANIDKVHKEAVAEAKTKWEENKKKVEAEHEKAVKKYEVEKQKVDAEAAKTGKIAATKLDYYPVPAGVELESDPSGANKISGASKWQGKYGKPWDTDSNDMHAYEIDLTDAVTGVAASGGTGSTQKLIVHYVPSITEAGLGSSKDKKYPARGGTVRIQYPAGASKDQIRDYTRAVTKILGADVRPASHKEQELNYLRRMAWLRRIEGFKVGTVQAANEPDGSLDEKIEWWVDNFKAPPADKGGGMGYDPRYEPERTPTGQPKKVGGAIVLKKNPDGSPKANPHYKPEAVDSGLGRFAYHRFDVTPDEMKKWTDSGLTLFKSSLTGDAKWSLNAMINSGGIYSTEKRAHIGMMSKSDAVTGLSSAADVKTGGANEVFCFIAKKEANNDGWGHFDPRLMLYTSAWHHDGDHYGAKAGGSVTGRTGSIQEDELQMEAVAASSHHQNEVLIGDRIPFWKWLTRLNVTKHGLDKKEVVKKLKAAGVTHAGPDNVPIEQVIH